MKGALAALLFLSAACAPRKSVAPPAQQKAGESRSDDPALTLERTPCFGRCPVYRLSISSNGLVSYHGVANVRQLGDASGQIPAERVAHLLQELEEAGYFLFASRYTPAESTCGRYATDLPTAITSVSLEGRRKRIEHDQGCGAAPGALRVLEHRIDEVAQSSRWTGH